MKTTLRLWSGVLLAAGIVSLLSGFALAGSIAPDQPLDAIQQAHQSPASDVSDNTPPAPGEADTKRRVPLPSGAWVGLALLAAIAVVRVLQRRSRAAMY